VGESSFAGRRDHDSKSSIIVHLLQESIFEEIVAESLPQLIIQAINQTMNREWTTLGYISIIMSVPLSLGRDGGAAGAGRVVGVEIILDCRRLRQRLFDNTQQRQDHPYASCRVAYCKRWFDCLRRVFSRT
jgi:hypothetical protein